MLRFFLIVVSLCVIPVQAMEILGIDAPDSVVAGNPFKVVVKVSPEQNASTMFGVGDKTQGAYALLKDCKFFYETSSAEAILGKLAKFVKIPLNSLKSGGNIWVHGKAPYVDIVMVKDGKKSKKKTVSLSGKTGKWAWQPVLRVSGACEYQAIEINTHSKHGIDCVLVSYDADFNPNMLKGGFENIGNNVFELSFPKYVSGNQKVRVWASKDGVKEVSDIQINVIPFSSKKQHRITSDSINKNDLVWLPLDAAANISFDNKDSKIAPVFDHETIKNGGFSFHDIEFRFPDQVMKYTGIWAKVDNAELSKKNAEVAQANDKVMTKSDLPSSVEIKVNGTYDGLSFLHSIAGSGEIGDLLWEYVVLYEDGKEVVIDIREGQEVSGYLKGEKTDKAELVWERVIDNNPSKVYFYIWKNPFPNKKITRLKFNAVYKKTVPMLIGLAGIKPGMLPLPKEAVNSETNDSRIYINILDHIKPVKTGLFSINDPYMSSAGPRAARLIDSSKSWNIYRQMKFRYDRIWIGKCLPQKSDEEIDYNSERFFNADRSMRKIGQTTATKIILNIKPPKWSYAAGDDFKKRCVRSAEQIVEIVGKGLHAGWPVEYIELFNETLIRHPSDEVKRKYELFNAIAIRLKEKFPDIKIAGTAECWPAVGVLKNFMDACGKNVDALSWHMYSTGRPETSNDNILKTGSIIARSSRMIGKMLKKYFPGRKVEQLVTEYNINYAAWLNGGESRQHNAIGALWLMSVMNHLLYTGEADIACHWHYEFGSCYGIGGGNDKRLSPMGTGLWILNNFVYGNLLYVNSNSPKIECIGVDNGKEYVFVLLNIGDKNRKVSLRLFNYNQIEDSINPQIRLFSASGEDQFFRVNILHKSELPTVDSPFSVQPYSVNVFIVPHN